MGNGEEKVIGKIVLEGTLKLCSPMLIGDGMGDKNHDNDKDIHVLKNQDGYPFIPGTSLAGVLRAEMDAIRPVCTKEFFGQMDYAQSAVSIDDIVFTKAQLTYRDGVRIDPDTGTAANTGKYDDEAVERGAGAPMQREVTLRGCRTANPQEWQTAKLRPEVLDAAAFLRDALQDGIHLGALTAKGFGLAKVQGIAMGLYDFAKAQDVKSWLTQEVPSAAKAGAKLTKPGSWGRLAEDTFDVKADFALRSSLLVRSYGTDAKGKSIAVMLKSGKDAVIPGTSLKGVLRHQAAAMTEELGIAPEFLDALMGTAERKDASNDAETEGRVKSRFLVDETYITLDKHVIEKEHTRNRIDRFTGGTVDSALFTTRPIWQKDKDAATVHLHFQVQKADEKEAGLALFLLKDLSQGRIAIGGEPGSGRGTLRGLGAVIQYAGQTFRLDADGKVTEGSVDDLNRYAHALSGKEA